MIPHIPYNGKEQFPNKFKRTKDTIGRWNEWLLITGINRTIFETDFREPESSPFSRWAAYDAELALLLVRIAQPPAHEAGIFRFSTILLEALEPMGTKSSLSQIGGSTHFADMGGKEADNAFKPFNLPRGRSHVWPSVVLEVAYSERRAELQRERKVVITRHSFGVRFSGAPLIIAFSKPFIRQSAVPWEQDVVLDQDKLRTLAQAIWHYKESLNE
ncbi:hypothetical protein BDW68DRAFT_187747 [Aspergillus falconensis]